VVPSHPTQGNSHYFTFRRELPKHEISSKENYTQEIGESEEEQTEFGRTMDENAWQKQVKPTFSEVLNDFEFIEFLKNVALFCTKEDDDEAVQSLGQHSILYKNLLMLRNKFQLFKKAKHQQEFDNEESDSEEQPTMTKEAENNEFKNQLEVWNTVRNGKGQS
jgi:hypothetical protein